MESLQWFLPGIFIFSVGVNGVSCHGGADKIYYVQTFILLNLGDLDVSYLFGRGIL
jgi:hypothetical protein